MSFFPRGVLPTGVLSTSVGGTYFHRSSPGRLPLWSCLQPGCARHGSLGPAEGRGLGRLWGSVGCADVPEWLAPFFHFLNNLFSVNSSK